RIPIQPSANGTQTGERSGPSSTGNKPSSLHGIRSTSTRCRSRRSTSPRHSCGPNAMPSSSMSSPVDYPPSVVRSSAAGLRPYGETAPRKERGETRFDGGSEVGGGDAPQAATERWRTYRVLREQKTASCPAPEPLRRRVPEVARNTRTCPPRPAGSLRALRERMNNPSLSTQVTLHPQLVAVTVQDPRPDSLQTFGELTEPQPEQLAHDAWHVGLRALMNAYRQAEEARLLDVGETLRENLDAQFREHADRQTQGLAGALGRYFDPEHGEVSQRRRELTRQDGALGRLLEQHLGPRNSV